MPRAVSLMFVFWLMLASPDVLFGAALTQARLVLSHTEVRPGDSLMAGVHLQMPPRWHTYWKNPGESGKATTIEWRLPSGVTAGDIQWPLPEKYVNAAGGVKLTTYVYHHEVVLLVPLQIAASAEKGTRELKAFVSWLECEDNCLPGNAELSGTLEIGAASRNSSEAEWLRTWTAKIPATNRKFDVQGRWEKASSPGEGVLQVEWKTENVSKFDFYTFPLEGVNIMADTEFLAPAGNSLRLRKQVKFQGETMPTAIAGVIVSGEPGHPGYEVSVPVSGSSIAKAPPATGADGSRPGIKAADLVRIMIFSVLGGLILNIMPCVLPVISLKILGFVEQSHQSPREVKWLGFAYTAGVLASFLVMALLVIQVKRAGGIASWGMQFQNPQFLIVMTVLVVVVALNLFGVFEVNLGGRAMDSAAVLAAKPGYGGSFLNGVLSTALATPCTAPFLSAALGFAFTRPAQIVILVFLLVGLGLALPYLILSVRPQWLKFLPRPGVWMQHFKVLMGFPMLATGIWLYSLVLPHYSRSGPFWLGLFLVSIGLGLWIFGQFIQRAGRSRIFPIIAAMAAFTMGYVYALEKQMDWRHPQRASGTREPHQGLIAWKKWSPQAVVEAREAGKVVLVDFTADWCPNCQVNTKFALEVPSVQKKIQELGVIPFLADWSFPDAEIAGELNRLDHPAIPLMLVYPADKAKPPVKYSGLLTPQTVINALEKAVQ